jgi:glyoxylase-like metal-dependent hydrolase (beta-lactamase superfamily II)
MFRRNNMFKKLRIATIAIVMAVGGAGIAQAADKSTSVKETTREIAPGVYSFAPGKGYHSMFVVTKEGVAAFETVNSKHASGLVDAIRKITDKPIKYALHSHNHWDHANGGQVMQKVGAETVMHKLAAEWLAANPGRDSSTPDIVWEGERHDIKLGDITIQMHYLGMNHGLGMTVFVIPEHKVAYIADLVVPNRVMFTIVPDFNIREWERSLVEIEGLDFEIAVCSHNELAHDEALNGCNKKHVAEQAAFIKDLRNAIFAEFKKGTPPFTIPSVIKLPKYAHWKHYDEWLEMNALRVMLDLWMGPYPWMPE